MFANGDSTQVDAYAYNSVCGGSDRSVGRFPDGGDTWRIFDQLDKVPTGSQPEGSGCAPTPGGPNGCPSAVKNPTWGMLKRWYLQEGTAAPRPAAPAPKPQKK